MSRGLALAALVLAAQGAHALQISSVTPQGEVAKARQVVAKFDRAAVDFGDPKAPSPFTVSCDDAQAKGTGRWTSDKQWVFDFESDLPPGTRCTISRVASFKSAGAEALSGPERYQFNTGGPSILGWRPSYGKIDEEQIFMLELNGPATLDSVRDNIWCAADGIGERIPVKMVEGESRNALLKAVGRDKEAEKAPLRFVTLQCNRTLTPASRVQLVYGKGVATPSGVVNNIERRLDFEVREPFAVSFSCERENAQAACLPLRPLVLQFNAPVSRKLAGQITLKGDGKTVKPRFENESAAKDEDAVVDSVSFAPPFAEQAQFAFELPVKFMDASSRALAAPESFPLKIETGAMPPLAKFAAAPFGVIERLAEPGEPALLPVTVRRVEPALRLQALTPGKVSAINPKTDADIIAWFRKVRRYDSNYTISRKEAAKDIKGTLPKVIDKEEADRVQTRMVSLLGGQSGVKALDMPKSEGGDPRPFEVIGIPLSPGFHVLEIASQKLGDALLDERHGSDRTMFVRTTALATNLAVHFKLGRENALAWVTSLDKGKVVAGAAVRVSDCTGKDVASGVTDERGLVRLAGIAPEAPSCSSEDDYSADAYFVSARAKDEQGVEDLAFTWSDWQRGIEPWRFNVPTSARCGSRQHRPTPSSIEHLFRAGETISMKHLIRTQTLAGLRTATEASPDTLVVTHVGSGQQYTQPDQSGATPRPAGSSGENTFARSRCRQARRVSRSHLRSRQARRFADMEEGGQRSEITGRFRVEEFRLPVLQGSCHRRPPTRSRWVAASFACRSTYRSATSAAVQRARLPVQVSALTARQEPLVPRLRQHSALRHPARKAHRAPGTVPRSIPPNRKHGRIVADKLPLTLGQGGQQAT